MTGSIASAKDFPGVSVYSASKAAIRSFARTWTTGSSHDPHGAACRYAMESVTGGERADARGTVQNEILSRSRPGISR
jgi:hypothetical protein